MIDFFASRWFKFWGAIQFKKYELWLPYFLTSYRRPGEKRQCAHVCGEGRRPRKTTTTGARQWSSFLSLLSVFSVIVFFMVATPRCLADANASPPLLPERQYKALRVGHLDVEMRDHATKFTAALISPINRGFRITSKQHGWCNNTRPLYTPLHISDAP